MKIDVCENMKIKLKAKTGRDGKHILHFPLPTRIACLVLSRLALFAQKFVNVALRRHCSLLDSSRDVHNLLLLLRLRLRLRLMVRHGCMIVYIHAARLMLLLLLLWLRLVLDIVLIMQRRVQKIVAAHGCWSPGAGPVSS
jgi:hypothetical protein